MTAEERLKKIREIEDESQDIEWMNLHPRYIDLIADLVVERLKKG